MIACFIGPVALALQCSSSNEQFISSKCEMEKLLIFERAYMHFFCCHSSPYYAFIGFRVTLSPSERSCLMDNPQKLLIFLAFLKFQESINFVHYIYRRVFVLVIDEVYQCIFLGINVNCVNWFLKGTPYIAELTLMETILWYRLA